MEAHNICLGRTNLRPWLNKASKDGNSSHNHTRIASTSNNNISSSREPRAPTGITLVLVPQRGKLCRNTSCKRKSLAWRGRGGKIQLYDSMYM